MWNEVEEFISPEKALKSISLVSEQFEESENPSSVVDFQTHPLPGKTVEEYGWFHNVRTITEERKPSESADTTSTIEAIDKGPPEQLVDTKYSGIVEQKKVDCSVCGGDGRTCYQCDGTGTTDCPSCGGSGVITHSCGCTTKNTHWGYMDRAEALTGEVLQTCTNCGGSGKFDSYDGNTECSTCEGKGAFATDCQNCGGDGVSGRETCSQCNRNGFIICQKCNDTADVDDCSDCEATGIKFIEKSKQFEYYVVEDKLIKASDLVENNKDEIYWKKAGSDIIEKNFEIELKEISEQSRTDELVKAKRVKYEPWAYEAELVSSEINVFAGSVDDESLTMLVSSDGLVDWDISASRTVENRSHTDSKIDKSESPLPQPSPADKLRSVSIWRVAEVLVLFITGFVGGEILATDILRLAQDALLTWAISLILPIGLYVLVRVLE